MQAKKSGGLWKAQVVTNQHAHPDILNVQSVLHALKFIAEGDNAMFIGQPGTGKSHAARLLADVYAEAAPGARPGLILFVQTFGDLANFNPHVQVLAADGVFRADGAFVPLPPIPEALLAEGFRRAVLEFLVKARAITDEWRSRLLGWRHCGGFSVHNPVRGSGQRILEADASSPAICSGRRCPWRT